MFDIRKYKTDSSNSNDGNSGKLYWGQQFLKSIDDELPKINKECDFLFNNRDERTQDAFEEKLDLWGDFVGDLQKLCKIYKLYDAQCLKSED